MIIIVSKNMGKKKVPIIYQGCDKDFGKLSLWFNNFRKINFNLICNFSAGCVIDLIKNYLF